MTYGRKRTNVFHITVFQHFVERSHFSIQANIFSDVNLLNVVGPLGLVEGQDVTCASGYDLGQNTGAACPS